MNTPTVIEIQESQLAKMDRVKGSEIWSDDFKTVTVTYKLVEVDQDGN